MRLNSTLLLTLFSLFIFPISSYADCGPLLDFESKKLHSQKTVNFCEAFKDKVLLAVNTASQCGFTPIYDSLRLKRNRF